jgi:lipopolysaccharide transport protein LptA
MKTMRSSLFFLVFFLGIVLHATVCPSDTVLETTDLGVIIINSDSFIWKTREKIVVFSEDVTARIKDLTIECDEMRVYYSEKSNEGEPENAESFIGDIDRILATGNVKITRTDGLSGTAEKAVYDINEKTIVMTGQPTFQKGKSSWKGSSLTYNVIDESISGKDVKAVLYQEDQEGVSAGGQ